MFWHYEPQTCIFGVLEAVLAQVMEWDGGRSPTPWVTSAGVGSRPSAQAQALLQSVRSPGTGLTRPPQRDFGKDSMPAGMHKRNVEQKTFDSRVSHRGILACVGYRQDQVFCSFDSLGENLLAMKFL